MASLDVAFLIPAFQKAYDCCTVLLMKLIRVNKIYAVSEDQGPLNPH